MSHWVACAWYIVGKDEGRPFEADIPGFLLFSNQFFVHSFPPNRIHFISPLIHLYHNIVYFTHTQLAGGSSQKVLKGLKTTPFTFTPSIGPSLLLEGLGSMETCFYVTILFFCLFTFSAHLNRIWRYVSDGIKCLAIIHNLVQILGFRISQKEFKIFHFYSPSPTSSPMTVAEVRFVVIVAFLGAIVYSA